MYEANVDGQRMNAVKYFVLSQVNQVNPPASCPACNNPVHFSGKEAAMHRIIGVRAPDAINPHFDHFDHAGLDCPRRASHRSPNRDGIELLNNPETVMAFVRPTQKFRPSIEQAEQILAVWAHMLDERNVSLATLDKAVASAPVRGADALIMRNPQKAALSLALLERFPIEGTRRTREVMLVPRIAATLSKREAARSKHDDLYLIFTDTKTVFGGPFHNSEEALAKYARGHIRWAQRQMQSPLDLRLAS